MSHKKQELNDHLQVNLLRKNANLNLINEFCGLQGNITSIMRKALMYALFAVKSFLAPIRNMTVDVDGPHL